METIELKDSMGRVVGTIAADEWNSWSPEQQKAFMAQFEGAAGGEAPTQRTRALAQGLTLGFSDEIAAAAQNPLSFLGSTFGLGMGDGGKEYEQALKAERDALAEYRKAYPYSSLAWEVGGAAAPMVASLVAAPFTGGASTAAAAPTAGRLAGVMSSGLRGAISGGKYGAAYGFGSGEGDVFNRAANAGVNAVAGAGLGGALGTVLGAGKEYLVNGFVNWLRNKAGDRMAGVVAAEVQRMAEQSGMTADEIVAGVAEGRLMAENRTLMAMIRRFYAEGGPAGAEIKTTLSGRPAETRKAALEAMQAELADPGNPLANKRASDVLAREAEDIAYEGAFRPGGVELPAPPAVVAEMENLARRTPSALKYAAEVARTKYGINPFFTIDDAGVVTFSRSPTLREADLVYRSLRDLKNEAYQSGRGSLGAALEDTANAFKGALDTASAPLAAARAEAATVRTARDAFVAGQQATTKSPDQLALIVSDIEALGPEAVKAFREGFMTAMRASLAKPAAAPGMMRALAEETTGPGTALRMALPQGASERVVPRIVIASDAQAAKSAIVDGSQTAQTMMAPNVGGSVSAAQEVASGFSGDMMAWARLIGNLADNMRPGLTDAQRLEVARIVLSKDPNLVLRALKDNSLVGQLQAGTAEAIDKVVQGGTRAAAPTGARLTGSQDRN